MNCNLIEIRRMGSGSFGVTYEVEDFKSGEKSAYKVFTENLGFILSLVEIDVFFRIKNPNLISGKDLFFPKGLGKECILSSKHKNTGENGGVVMTLQRGDTLRLEPLFKRIFEARRESSPTFQSEKIIDWSLRMCIQSSFGLECLHSSGYYHRDIKLENILYSLSPEGEVDFRVADYGFCYPIRSVEQIVYNYGSGTSGYFPPEYYYDDERLDNTNDVYALGVAIFSLMMGENELINAEEIDSQKRINNKKTLENLNYLLNGNYLSKKFGKLREKFISDKISGKYIKKYDLLASIIIKMLSYSSSNRPTFPEILSEIQDALPPSDPLLLLFEKNRCYTEEVVFVMEDEKKVRSGLRLLLTNYPNDRVKIISFAMCIFLRIVRFLEGSVDELIKKSRNLSIIFYEQSSSKIKKISPNIIDECIEIVGVLEGKLFCDPIYKRITTVSGLKQFLSIVNNEDLKRVYNFLNYENDDDIIPPTSFFEQDIFEMKMSDFIVMKK